MTSDILATPEEQRAILEHEFKELRMAAYQLQIKAISLEAQDIGNPSELAIKVSTIKKQARNARSAALAVKAQIELLGPLDEDT